ncbi:MULTISPECIES: AAA family ATPase, partial [Helicobacter]
MKLVKIKIENFRSYDNVEVELSNLSVIVGQNDVGKSTLLDALNIFFENEKPLHNDNNIFSQKEEIIITAFFEADKQMEIFLDSAESEKTQTTLIDEYLLDNNGLL